MNDQFWEVVARRKVGGNPEWRWCSCEAIGRDFLVKGAVPRVLTRGKRKGEYTWRGLPLETVVVSRDEFDTAEREYVATTGNCPDCRGSGKQVASWNATEGVKYRACQKCSGTGRAS